MQLEAGVNTVTIRSFGVDLVGHLYLPKNFDANREYIAIVGGSPFPQVKEQALAIYGQAMSDRGFIFWLLTIYQWVTLRPSQGSINQREICFE